MRDTAGVIIQSMPQSRYRNADIDRLNRYGSGPFCTFSIGQSQKAPGVYALTSNEELVYIGKCQSLADRFGPRGYGAIHPKNCYVGGQPTNCKVNDLILQEALGDRVIKLWFHETTEPAPVERELIVRLRPHWNTQTPW
jgi:hypothetical protein